MTKHKPQSSWFLIGLIAVLLAAPNATVIKYGVGDSGDPVLFNVLRFGVISAFTLPLMWRHRRFFNKTNTGYAIVSGLLVAIAALAYVEAIRLSQASYVSIIALVSPVVFMVLSVKINREKISRRVVAGVGLAGLGAVIVVLMPVILDQTAGLSFNARATILALTASIAFPASTIFSKRANKSGLPIISLVGVTAWMTTIASLVFYLSASSVVPNITLGFLLAGIYSGLVVSFIARILIIKSYEIVGSGITGALAYVEAFMAVSLPVLILGEKLTQEMIIGGLLIFAGVVVAQYHKSGFIKHYILHKHH